MTINLNDPTLKELCRDFHKTKKEYDRILEEYNDKLERISVHFGNIAGQKFIDVLPHIDPEFWEK